MAKKFKKKTIAIIGVIAGALLGLGYQAINLFGNQAVYGVPQEYYDEKEMFNSRFSAYEGEIEGSRVMSLISTIRTKNRANIQENDKIVSFNGINSEEELVNIKASIKSGRKYNIALEYDDEGYIKNIICEEVK